MTSATPLRVVALLTGLFVVSAVAACGSGDTTAKSADASPSPIASTAVDSAAAAHPTASVAQYASIIAKERADFAESAEKLRPCAIDSSDFVCVATLLSASLQAETLDIQLEGASVDGPNNQLYIGPPPAEIESLVADTRSAAQEVQARADAYDACSSRCEDEFAQAYFAASDLDDQLKAWEPYL